jgi:CRISPR/Cas system CMR-associated protein Cmr1 (group 7 of RAMP superfamily)
MTSYHLTFITPLFSKGSYDDRPEIRPPSIRGQLHWWFRALGGRPADENAIFGGVHGGAVASKIVVRVSNVHGQTGEIDTLPRKHGGQASPKASFVPGTSFDLHFLERLGGLSDTHRAAFQRTMEAWLLLGTLGLRATRAAGSFSWGPLTGNGPSMPTTFDAWNIRCAELLKGAPLKLHLIDESFATAEEARRIVSDTIGGRSDRQGDDSLARINHPLGRIFNGRKTSPLRFRIIPIANRYHIAAVWDNRSTVTGNRESDLPAVINLLMDAEKQIGRQLKDWA